MKILILHHTLNITRLNPFLLPPNNQANLRFYQWSFKQITFAQIQDGEDRAAACLPQVIVGDAGVQASIAGFAVPNPQPSILLVLHVDEVIIVVPVQGWLGVSRHRYLEADITARPHGSVPHFAYEDGWRRRGTARTPRVRSCLFLTRFGSLWGYDGAGGRHCFICPFLQGLCLPHGWRVGVTVGSGAVLKALGLQVKPLTCLKHHTTVGSLSFWWTFSRRIFVLWSPRSSRERASWLPGN